MAQGTRRGERSAGAGGQIVTTAASEDGPYRCQFPKSGTVVTTVCVEGNCRDDCSPQREPARAAEGASRSDTESVRVESIGPVSDRAMRNRGPAPVARRQCYPNRRENFRDYLTIRGANFRDLTTAGEWMAIRESNAKNSEAREGIVTQDSVPRSPASAPNREPL